MLALLATASISLFVTDEGAQASSVFESDRGLTPFVKHAPIEITSNQDFTSENGVREGTGTESDPFVIEGWEIDATEGNGISVRGTDAHFVLRNLRVNAWGHRTGIGLGALRNGVIENVTVEGSGRNSTAIVVLTSDNIRISEATIHRKFYGIRASWSTNLSFENNRISETYIGFYLYGNRWVNLARNDLMTMETPIYMRWMEDVILTSNSIQDSVEPIHINAINVTLESNTFDNGGILLEGEERANYNTHNITPDNLVLGRPILYYRDCTNLQVDGVAVGQLIVANCSGVRIANLEVSRAVAALQLAFADSVVIEDNALLLNGGYGLRMMSVSDATVARNHIVSNGYGGISLDSVQGVTLTDNNLVGNGALSESYHFDTHMHYWYDGGGVSIARSKDITIAGNTLLENRDGIQVLGSQGVHVTGNNITRQQDVGVWLGIPWCYIEPWSCPPSTTSGVTIEANDIEGNGHGIGVFDVPGRVDVVDNHLKQNDVGVYLRYSLYLGLRGSYSRPISTTTTVVSNTFSGNNQSIYLRATNVTISGNSFETTGISMAGSSREPEGLLYFGTHNITPNNAIQGRPVLYYRNRTGLIVENVSVGQLIVANSTGIEVKGLQIAGVGTPVLLAFVEGALVEGNEFLSSREYGLRLISVRDARVVRNTISNNDLGGVQVLSSSDLSIAANQIEDNGLGAGLPPDRPLRFSRMGGGIHVSSSNNLTLERNSVKGNYDGIQAAASENVTVIRNDVSLSPGVGIWAGPFCWLQGYCFSQNLAGVRVVENVVESNGVGIAVLEFVEWATIVGNVLAGNGVGVHVEVAPYYLPELTFPSVSIYHNNFVRNEVQAIDKADRSFGWEGPVWHAGYPDGGNFWSHYTGQDMCSGPRQVNCPDPDGIGDTPLAIRENAQDLYPLIEPYAPVRGPPLAAFTVLASPADGTVVNVDASSSSDDQDPTDLLEVRWDWGDDGIWDTAWRSEKTAAHRYLSLGTHRIRLEVKDSDGMTTQATRLVEARDTISPTIQHIPIPEIRLFEGAMIHALVEDSFGVAEVVLYYRGTSDEEYTPVTMARREAKMYQAEIPVQLRPGSVTYYIIALDKTGNPARSPEMGVYRIEVLVQGAPLSPSARAAISIIGVLGVVLAFSWYARWRRR